MPGSHLKSNVLCDRDVNQRTLKHILGKGNFKLLNVEERRLASTLVSLGHASMFRNWPPPGELGHMMLSPLLHRRAPQY